MGRKGKHRKTRIGSPVAPPVQMSLEMLALALPVRREPRAVPVLAVPAVAALADGPSAPPKVVWAPILRCEVEGCAEFANSATTAPASLRSGRPLPFQLCEIHTLSYLTTHAH